MKSGHTVDKTAIRHIVWDWNGTLLNDAQACAAAVDALMRRRGLAGESLAGYRDRIRFPVRAYYELTGFDLEAEAYEVLCDEFGDAYARAVAGEVPPQSSHAGFPASDIHTDVREVLEASRAAGVTHAIVSASEQGTLARQVAEYGLTPYFTSLVGRDDNHGGTKDHLVREWVRTCGYPPEQILYVGDTEHDEEAASSAGIRVAMVADGHVSAGRLHRVGVPVFENRRALWESVRPLTAHPVYRAMTFDTVLGRMAVLTNSLGVVRTALPAADADRESALFSAREAWGHPAAPDDATRRAAARIADWLAHPEPDMRLPVSTFGTGFQRAVWREARRIPFGETASYGQLAMRIGQPGAARAVAQALRANPTALVVPCHRVVGANGTPTGFMGRRDNPMQQWLLDLERKAASR